IPSTIRPGDRITWELLVTREEIVRSRVQRRQSGVEVQCACGMVVPLVLMFQTLIPTSGRPMVRGQVHVPDGHSVLYPEVSVKEDHATMAYLHRVDGVWMCRDEDPAHP